MLFPFALGIVPALVFGLHLDGRDVMIGAAVVLFVCLFCIGGTFVMLAYKRKGQVTKLFEDWNKTDGPSPDRFWRSIYPRNITIGNGNTTDTYDIFNDIEYAIFSFGL